MAIKVKMKNDEGKEIVKEIDDNMYSLYVNIGWEVVKDEPKKVDILKPIKKVDKDISGEDL